MIYQIIQKCENVTFTKWTLGDDAFSSTKGYTVILIHPSYTNKKKTQNLGDSFSFLQQIELQEYTLGRKGIEIKESNSHDEDHFS